MKDMIVKDLMVPLEEYATVSEDATLYEAVMALEKAQEELDLTKDKYKHRAVLVYDKDKTSYRSEVDQALKAKPDFLYLNGYAPDIAVVLRDLYRAGYDGDRFCQSYALTAKSLEELPKEVTQGVYTVQPSADVDSPAYAATARMWGSSS